MKSMLRHKTLFLLGFPLIIYSVLFFVFQFDGYYGQDSYEYLRYSKALYNFMLTGENPGDYFWPLYYPLVAALFSFITQNVTITLVLISVFSLSFSAIYLHKIFELLFPNSIKNSTLYVILFYLFSPFVMKSGMLAMSDMLAICFIVLTIYQYIKIKQKLYIKHFYFIAAFSVMAVMTRYASVVIIFPFIVLAAINFFNYKANLKHIPLLILLVCFLFMPHLLVRYSNYSQFLSHQWLQDWSITNFFKSDFITEDGIAINPYPNIFYGFSNLFHPRYLFMGIFFIPFLFQKKFAFSHQKTIAISIILYAFFLAGIPFQNNRFLLLSFPLVIICFYPVFVYLINLKSAKKVLFIGLIFIFIIQSFLIIKAFKPVITRNHLEKNISQILKPFQGQRLYGFDIDVALKGRGLEFDYYNLWKKKYSNYKEGDLVLFHPTKFNEQWKGKNPILNWNYLNAKYNLSVIKACPDGWNLYKIEK